MEPWLLRVLVAAVVLVTSLATPSRARADAGPHTVPVAVLAFETEDADDQADALTGALRSRVRASQGWSLIETTQSLGMLLVALKCPARPTPECQQKIGDQIKAERYVWGFVSKGPDRGHVTAEVHLYQKGKPDTVVREIYADNLKDANDDTLRKIAQRIVDRLSGTTLGAVVVRARDVTGDVVIDGDKRVPLSNGSARIELSAGGHSIEIASPAPHAPKRNILVAAGRETVVEMGVAAAHVAQPAPSTEPEKPFPTRKVIGAVALGAGLAMGAVAVQQFVLYGNLQTRGDEKAKEVTAGEKPCEAAPTNPEGTYNLDFCNIHKRAKLSSGLAMGLGASAAVALGVGVWLFFGGSDAAEKGPSPKGSRPRVLVDVGQTNGLLVVGSF